MKYLLKKVIEKLGFRLTRISAGSNKKLPEVMLKSRETTYLDQLVEVASFIPSMLTTESAKMLYALCYMQRLEGHVVEVGSWQGYSTSFLARAVKDSKNGSLYAIDHFKGNIGKEHFYTIGSQDLSDLRKGFEANLIKVGLFDYVNLLAMSNDQAAKELEGKKIRFLFIEPKRRQARW